MAADGTSGGAPSRGQVRQASPSRGPGLPMSFLSHRALPSAGVVFLWRDHTAAAEATSRNDATPTTVLPR
jgi:hypothetical protein